jgi:hypothetical protein
MANDDKVREGRQIHVSAADETARGRYSNSMLVVHSREEFIIDWLLNATSGAHLVARIVVSPAHMKRIIGALAENLRKYEEQHGAARETDPEGPAFH